MKVMNRLNAAVRSTIADNRMVLCRLDTSSLLAGALLGSLAVVVINLLLTIHVYRYTDSSPLAVSALFVITFLPNLVIAPLCSGLADRWNRRLLLGVCGLVRALLCALLIANWSLPILLLLAFAITSVSAITKPARYALVAQLTTGPLRVALNSMLMIVTTFAGIVGGGFLALLTHVVGREVFGVMALISALGGLLDMVRFRRVPTPIYQDSPSLMRNANNDDVLNGKAALSQRPRLGQRLVDGWRLVRFTPALFALTVSTTLLWFGLGVQEPLLVVFVDRVLAAPDATYALLATIGSVGGLVGAGAATPLAGDTSAAARNFSVSLVLAGLCFVMFAASNGSIIIAFVAFFLFNATYGVSNVIDEYLEQEMSPDHLRATVISAIGAVGTLGYLLGGGSTGLAVNSIGPVATAVGIGLVITCAGIYALFQLRVEREESQ
ncbi:MFS transporter [Actinomyces ruminicola]|uniref:MFS transporter n=1 Tax=Actinomyces ruminicola TaxID=332524 RepID=UPI0011CB5921|nr:MFS transporter [Actinomyces ruminicola]